MNGWAIFFGLFLIGCSSSQVSKTEPAAAKTAETAAATATSPATTPEKKTDAKEAMKVTCKLGSDDRVMEKVEKDGGCELRYTKFGETKVSATSSVGTAHCDEVQDRIRKNLEKFGFQCSSF